MEETLEASLARLFGGPSSNKTQDKTSDKTGAGETAAAAVADGASPIAATATQARESYQRAIEAQRAGDWARYGEELQRLGRLLEQMAQSSEKDRPEKNKP